MDLLFVSPPSLAMKVRPHFFPHLLLHLPHLQGHLRCGSVQTILLRRPPLPPLHLPLLLPQGLGREHLLLLLDRLRARNALLPHSPISRLS